MIRPVLPSHLHECLVAAADGLTMVQEAARHHLSLNTVKTRRHQLCDVLDARTLAQAVHTAHLLDLLDRKPGPMPAVVLAEGAPLAELVRARMLLGWSRPAAASRVGRSAGWLRARERGEQLFGWGELTVYADVLGVDLGRGSL